LKLDSAFQLQEHLKALHYHYTKPSNDDRTVPITRETALLVAVQPDGLDRALWLYELCRFLINKCNDLIIGFLFDDPPCSASTCPEMRASEWQFLCAVHESPKSCCAIDYCCHTLDWATNIVTSQKIFPSRLSLGAGDAVDDRGAGVKHLINIFRRLHRIFAHAWFQHREVFWRVEGQTGLYVLFKTVCDQYELLPAENYKLPPEAEGLEPIEEVKAPVPAILKSEAPSNNKSAIEEEFISVGRTNTRRHIRQSPSVGSAVTTVLESDEEDPDVTQSLEDLQINDDEGGAEIPVIVETYEVDEHQEVAGEEVESKAEDEPGGTDNTEIQNDGDDHSAPSSTTSSWDRMSSDSLEEKSEATDATEAETSEPAPETEEVETAPVSETDQAEGKEETIEKEPSAAKESEEEKKAEES
jgi:hypothetical protein